VFYFDTQAPGANPIQHGSSPTNSLLRAVKEWNVPTPFIEEELRRQNVRSAHALDITEAWRSLIRST
jgi:hypothetical protein